MPPTLSVPGSRTKALMAHFEDTYLNRWKNDTEKLAGVMDFIPSEHNARDETFHYYESVPGFKRRDADEDRAAYGTFGDVTFTVETLEWISQIAWKRRDEEDAQTQRGLREAAQTMAGKASLIDIEVFFQILLAATDADRLPSVPTAPDGAALFSTAARFGDAAGNVLGGGGVATVAAIRNDWITSRARINAFKDTAGDFLHDDGIFDRGVTIIMGDANRLAFQEAFKAKVIQGTAAGIDNVLLAESEGDPVKLWSTARITDDDWFILLDDKNLRRPIFGLTRPDLGDLDLLFFDENNSDEARNKGIRGFDARLIRGYGVGPAYGSFKVNN